MYAIALAALALSVLSPSLLLRKSVCTYNFIINHHFCKTESWP